MIEKINIQKPNKNFPFGKPLPTYYDYILILNFYLLICSCLSMVIGFSSPHPTSNNLWNEIASINIMLGLFLNFRRIALNFDAETA